MNEFISSLLHVDREEKRNKEEWNTPLFNQINNTAHRNDNTTFMNTTLFHFIPLCNLLCVYIKVRFISTHKPFKADSFECECPFKLTICKYRPVHEGKGRGT